MHHYNFCFCHQLILIHTDFVNQTRRSASMWTTKHGCFLTLRAKLSAFKFYIDDLWLEETFFQDLNIFQIACGSETIFINWEQSVANATWNCRKFLIHSIAQSSAFISAWRGERLARTFLTPISPSNPSKVLNQPCMEKLSLFPGTIYKTPSSWNWR